ncbi:MAG: peptidoglycan glycosyltransferase, partial [Oscillospiraceae bacterium]|nr:peptidoglycan glycosyltransferase [Oscillospiraceae bacterium]
MPETGAKKPKVRKAAKSSWQRGYRSKSPSKSMKIRANAVILSLILAAAVILVINLFNIMIVHHKDYTDRAASRQFGSITLPAMRGTIYDANGGVLAQSATVYRIFVDPGLMVKEMELIENKNESLIKRAGDRRKQGINEKPDVVNPEDVKNVVINYLTETLELNPEDVRDAFDKTEKRYIVLKEKVEKNKADRIMEFMSDITLEGSERHIKLSCVSRESDTKRYYPQNNLAAAVIGFNNRDGHGAYGIEAYYDDYLSGIDGKNITAKDAGGNEMPYRFSDNFPAQDGDDVYLTIDMTMQTYLENALEDMVKTYEIANRACGVMLNAKTGAVLAMASVGGFDVNDPYTIYDPAEKARVDAITDEEEHNKALIEAREKQWRNKCVAETYIPGSVFKVFTASSALEENVINYEDHWFCEYKKVVSGEEFHCWKKRGHGDESFEDILTNSCNPAFIEIGLKMGADRFCQYFDAFGLNEKTGIDLFGESKSVTVKRKNMGPVELASSSFGQTNSLTPIQMVTGYAAVVNGGYLLQPYIVSKVVDKSGNVVLSNEKTVRRQVISEETSAEMRRALQAVVEGNGKKGAYIRGYKIGGKSGTAQKIQGKVQKSDEKYVASYCCFAPADDPEIVLLMMADEPNTEIDYYGSSVVGPYSREIFEKALPYLGFYPSYAEGDELDVSVPLMVDFTVEDAKAELEKRGLVPEVIGGGMYVNVQTPLT